MDTSIKIEVNKIDGFLLFFSSVLPAGNNSGAGCFPGAGHRKVPNAGKEGRPLFCLIARQKKGRRFPEHVLGLEMGSAIARCAALFMKNLLSRYISLSLALRYLNPLRTFFSIITLICLLGVSLGVMVLIVVLSVMGGLQKEIQGNLFAHSPHVQVCYRNDFGVREVIPDWLDLGEKLRLVPGVQSAYALIEDYALADVQGRQRPCFFRAIDTENAAQLEDLKRLVVAGDAELDMGEKAVVSSIVAENMGLNVGDVVRVYTTRNFQEISHAYQQTELPMLAEKNVRELKDLKEWGKNLKTEGEREMAGRASVDRAFSLLNGLLSVPRRDAERSSLMDLLAVLNDGEIADNGRVAFPQGTRKEWGNRFERFQGRGKK